MKNFLFLSIIIVLNSCQTTTYGDFQVYPNPLYTSDEKLSYAVRTNNYKNAKKYLLDGANPNTNKILCWSLYASLEDKIEKNCTPPMISMFESNNPEIINELINSGGDINREFDLFKDTNVSPLMFWVMSNESNKVSQVLKYKPNPNTFLSNSDSALFLAIANNNKEIVEFLLKAGADPNYKNSNNINALTAGVKIQNIEILKLLLSYGAKPDAYFWDEVLHYKVSNRYVETAYLTLNNKMKYENLFISNKDDIYNSKALVVSSNGDRYEGVIKNAKANGDGIFYKADGTIFKGTFKNGALADGVISLNGVDTLVRNSKPIDIGSATKLQQEYIRTGKSRNYEEFSDDAGEFIVNLALLPIKAIGYILTSIDWAEVARDLPAEYMKQKREQEIRNQAYKRAYNSGYQRGRSSGQATQQARCSYNSIYC